MICHGFGRRRGQEGQVERKMRTTGTGRVEKLNETWARAKVNWIWEIRVAGISKS